MKKRIFFTSKHSPHKDRNPNHTFVSFQYDTETQELKLVEEYEGKVYELSLGSSSGGEEQSDDNGGGEDDGGLPDGSESNQNNDSSSSSNGGENGNGCDCNFDWNDYPASGSTNP